MRPKSKLKILTMRWSMLESCNQGWLQEKSLCLHLSVCILCVHIKTHRDTHSINKEPNPSSTKNPTQTWIQNEANRCSFNNDSLKSFGQIFFIKLKNSRKFLHIISLNSLGVLKPKALKPKAFTSSITKHLWSSNVILKITVPFSRERCYSRAFLKSFLK